MVLLRLGPGRPRKYSRPARPVTVTLPNAVIARLTAIDADVGRAIVGLVERRGPIRGSLATPAAVSSYGHQAVIIVTPLKAFKRLPGVQLVPVGNGRALISLAATDSISGFELAVGDALERADTSAAERQALQAVTDILQHARRSRGVSVAERTIIVFESKRTRRRRPARPK